MQAGLSAGFSSSCALYLGTPTHAIDLTSIIGLGAQGGYYKDKHGGIIMDTRIKILTPALLAFLLVACGGGGGGGDDSSASAPSGNVDISAFTRPTTGSSVQFDLSGTISSGGTTVDANGTLSVSVGSTTTFNGQTALPADQSITIHIPSTGGVITSGGTSYSTLSGLRIGSVSDSGVTCLASSASAIPTQVQVGDSGFRYTQACDDGSSETSRWRAEAGNGTLDLALTFSIDNGTQTINGAKLISGV